MNTANLPFFLVVIHVVEPLGKNEIGKFLRKAAENAGLQRKFINNTARKEN